MEYVKLKEVCEISMGQSPDSSSYNKEMIGVPFFQGNADFGEKNPDVRAWTTKPRKMALINDILISVRAPIGALNYANKNCCIGRGLASIRPIKDFYLKEYIFYLLKSKKDELNKLGTGSTFKAINKSVLENLKVPILNVNDQTKIVKQLDMIKHIIKKEKTQISFFDNLIKSRFVEMFGDPFSNEKNWEQEKIKDIAVGKLSYGSSASAIKFDNNIRYVRITDITDSGDLIYDKKSPSEYEDKYLLNDGDILFARSGATVGKTFKYSKEKHGKCIYAGYLIRLVPNTSKVIAEYVFWYTKTEYYLSFIKNAQKAVAQPNINAQEYGNLTICVPPIELQYQFAYFVEQVNKSKFVVQKSIEELQTLYDSLMQKYFG